MPRRVGLSEDLEYADIHHMKFNKIENIAPSKTECSLPTLVAPAQDSRISKHCIEILQMEEAARVKKFNEDVISDIEDLHNNFPMKSLSEWDMAFDSSSIKLRRNIFTKDNFHSAAQEILTHEDKHMKSFNLTFSTSSEIIVSEIGGTTSKQINRVLCKNFAITNTKLKSEIIEKVNSAENMRNLLKYQERKTQITLAFQAIFCN